MNLKTIKNQIIEVLKNYNLDVELVIELEIPQDIKNGHLSTNFALKNNKVLNNNPRVIAEEVVELFNNSSEIEKVEIAGPGFINFYFTNDVFKKLILNSNKETLVEQENKSNDKYLLEYVSANPTGDLHLGHARIGVYADSTARVMSKTGYNITREYYINDAGKQMENLGLSVKYYYLENLGVKSEFPEDGYRGIEIQEIGKKLFDEFNEDVKDNDLEFFINYGYERNMEEINKILKEINIEFDTYASEKSYHENGSVEKCLEVLKDNGDTYEKDDALWLNTTKYNDDKDRVIKKSDGSFTYLTSDIAYHLDKFNRGYNKVVDILGGDHHGYVSRIKASIEALGKNKDDFSVHLVQMVHILKNNEAVKMSKRAGTSVTIKQLLEEVESEALRYFFIMRSPDTQLEFDTEIATKKSSENPVYYIQYAHARICSIINTAKENSIEPTNDIIKLNDSEIEISLHLSKYSEVVNEAARKRLPHMVANYIYELASLYHQYYNNEKVFVEDKDEVNKKLIINMAIKNVINDGLDLLGIKAKEKM